MRAQYKIKIEWSKPTIMDHLYKVKKVETWKNEKVQAWQGKYTMI